MQERPSFSLEERSAAALASLGAGPSKLRRLIEGFTPAEAWDALASGSHPADPDRLYKEKATQALAASATAACERIGASVLALGDARYPKALSDDRDAPAVLFALGDPTMCDSRPTVAIVGTRSATPYGVGVATELGEDLARAGVVVVSGLAHGIDEAAHRGALKVDRGRVYAVLGKALDGSLGRSQDEIRRMAASRGAVISELAPGSVGAPGWWFAVRNRLMAAVAHLVVVVECHVKGGALHTVRYARRRGVPVCAVPGSVRSPASRGTNELLVEGASAVRCAQDVLVLLRDHLQGNSAVAHALASGTRANPLAGWSEGHSGASSSAALDKAVSLDPHPSCVLEALDFDPVPLDTVILRCGLSLGDAALALEELSSLGLAQSEGGWWSRGPLMPASRAPGDLEPLCRSQKAQAGPRRHKSRGYGESMPPRLEPLPPEEWDDLVRSLATRTPEGEVRALNIFTTLDRHPDLFRRWVALGGMFLNGKLDARLRELVILRTAHHCRSDYEWAQHVIIASSVGVDEDEISALHQSLDSHHWSEIELLVLETADELHETFALKDRTWDRLVMHFDAPGLIELVMLVAFYHLVAMMISTLQIQVEDWTR